MSKEPTNSEFIEGARALLRQGANDAQWEFATLLRKACDRLEASEQQRKDLLIVIKKFGQHSQECRDERYPEKWHCVCGLEAAIAKDKTG